MTENRTFAKHTQIQLYNTKNYFSEQHSVKSPVRQMQHLNRWLLLCNDQRYSEVIKNDNQFDYTLIILINVLYVKGKRSGDSYIK